MAFWEHDFKSLALSESLFAARFAGTTSSLLTEQRLPTDVTTTRCSASGHPDTSYIPTQTG